MSWQELSQPAQSLGCLLSLFALAPIPWSWVESVAALLANDAILPSDSEALEDLRDEELLRLHLLQRTDEGTYQLHQLIREFFIAKQERLDGMDTLKQVYCKTMVVAADAIPDKPGRDRIVAVTPSIPHIEQAATLLLEWLSDEDLSSPFAGIARFWEGQGLYAQAEPWRQQGLSAVRDRLGTNCPDMVKSLNCLGWLHGLQERHQEAELLYRQSLDICQRCFGTNHPNTAFTLSQLAVACREQERYGEAESRFLQALEIKKHHFGTDHPDIAFSLYHLGWLYREQRRYAEAETVLLQALEIRQRHFGDDHPLTAFTINSLAWLYQEQGRYADAEPLILQDLAICQHHFGNNHPSTAKSLGHLAYFYQLQARYKEAETLYLQVLDIRYRLLGAEHPSTVMTRNYLKELQSQRGGEVSSSPGE